MGSGASASIEPDLAAAVPDDCKAKIKEGEFSETQIGILAEVYQNITASGNGYLRQGAPVESQVVKDLGGQSNILKFKNTSDKVSSAVQASITSAGGSLKHDKIYQGAGLQKLLADGAVIKPSFDKFGDLLADMWTSRDLATEFVAAPVKNMKRSEVKVRVAYNGQVIMLSDAVRGTMKLLSAAPETLQLVYDEFVKLLQDIDDILPGTRCQVIKFKDRYQRPAGSYRDWMFKLKINGYLCELQVNFAKALEVKETTEHKAYELQRMAEDNLLEAAMKSDRTAVLLMLSTGVKPLVKDSNGCTPLHYAAIHGDTELCEELIKAGANVLALDATGATPLHRAVTQGNTSATKMFLEKMSKCQVVDVSYDFKEAIASTWDTLLSRSDLAAIEPAMRSFMVDTMTTREEEWLLWCAKSGGAAAVKKLRSLGTRVGEFGVDAESGLPMNALDFAIQVGASDVVQVLLGTGARVERSGPHADVQSAAVAYARSNRANAFQALQLAVGKQESLKLDEVLPIAAQHGALDVLQILLNDGVKLSERDEYMEQRLQAAAYVGDARLIDLLLAAGVDVDTKKSPKNSPLFCAVDGGRVECVKLLLDRGADYKYSGASLSNMAMAAYNNRLGVLKLLHEHKADLRPALDSAKFYNKSHAVNLITDLLKQGA